MKPTIIIAIALVVGIIAGFLFLRARVAEHGTLAELPQRLAKLKLQDSDPKAFFGFYTRDVQWTAGCVPDRTRALRLKQPDEFGPDLIEPTAIRLPLLLHQLGELGRILDDAGTLGDVMSSESSALVGGGIVGFPKLKP